ncbi:Retroelement [Phytophthora palmivora]|uniref:Retroelement n=1 Tax=Phytophthora palmivora TaxID=4796 RepID=A0A2P4X9T9_9STRA|nr:Retroelement [Phytophthora palmivora]
MGVAGMPGTWSHLMEALFDKFEFAVVYLDDICDFSKRMEEHVEHLRAIGEVLRREQLYDHLSKCSFGQIEVALLGHMVSQAGISVDPMETEAIVKYPTPTNRKELLSRFIYDFAELARPLMDLTKATRDAKDEEEDKEPPLLDVTYTVHECDDAYGKNAAHIDGHRQQVNTVDYHFVSPHLASEMKRGFQRGYANDPAFKQQLSKRTETERFVKHNGLLYCRQKKGETAYRLCVPKSKKLRTDVIMECRDGATFAHPEGRRTYMIAAQRYYWSTMDKDKKEYVRTCEMYGRWKSSGQKKKGLLMPIPTPRECWEVVSMDFITGLPASQGYDAMFVIVNKLSKRPKYAPTYSTADAKDTANVFYDAVVRHHGLPKTIISERDSKFLSEFLKSMMKLVGVKPSMTTAHRAQADNQTEHQNLVLEDALRCMVSYHGDDWVTHLGTIEYANSTLSKTSTKMTVFEVDTGRKVSNLLTERMKELSDGILAEFANNSARERQEVVEQPQVNLKHAQERQKEYYDRKRRQEVFKEGDVVLLDTKNLPLKTVNKNTELKKATLAAKKFGRFVIERMMNDNVAKLILPVTMKRLNPAFNVALLSHYLTNRIDFPNRLIPKAAPINLDDETGEELYINEKLLKQRTRRRKREWLVKRHGLPEHEATWEREANIKHVSHW